MMIRRTPIRKVRSKLRRGRLKGSDLELLRVDCFLRDKGICQNCGKGTVFDLDQECDDAFHMAHIRNKRMFGDNLDNVQTECGKCHRSYHQNGPSREKPCKTKSNPKPITGFDL